MVAITGKRSDVRDVRVLGGRQPGLHFYEVLTSYFEIPVLIEGESYGVSTRGNINNVCGRSRIQLKLCLYRKSQSVRKLSTKIVSLSISDKSGTPT